MTYEELLMECDAIGITAKEKPLKYNDGRQKGNRIAIRNDITFSNEKACILAEELGHYHTTVGNILDQSNGNNRRQESCARLWAYNHLIGMYGIINGYRAGCRSLHEMAEYLYVTQEFLSEALERYRQKYGELRICVDNYVIIFEPSLQVLELI